MKLEVIDQKSNYRIFLYFPPRHPSTWYVRDKSNSGVIELNRSPSNCQKEETSVARGQDASPCVAAEQIITISVSGIIYQDNWFGNWIGNIPIIMYFSLGPFGSLDLASPSLLPDSVFNPGIYVCPSVAGVISIRPN